MAQDNTSVLHSFLEKLLKPIAVLCVRSGIKHREVAEILKLAFIKASLEELADLNAIANTSKLSAVTGLQRKDIRRLIEQKETNLPKGNLLTKVIGAWRSDPRFSLKRRTPRVLNYEGADSEFSMLVRSVSTDLNTYTVLFELERVGAVEKNKGQVELKVDAFNPENVPQEGLSLVATDVENLLLAGEENIFRSPPVPNLHLHTRYDNIAQKYLPQIRTWLLKEGALFHRKMRHHLSKYDKDLNPELFQQEGGGIVHIGSFSRIIKPTDPSLKEQNDAGKDS